MEQKLINNQIMKKTMITSVAAILFIMFLIMGCDKDKYHRDRYTGSWDFVTEKCIKKYEDHVLVELINDTIYYSGVISCGSADHELIIQYTQSDTLVTFINKNGGIYVPICPCAGYACTRGDFESKTKMDLYFGWSYQNKEESHHIVGTKKGRR
jgi:hypothetical protein